MLVLKGQESDGGIDRRNFFAVVEHYKLAEGKNKVKAKHLAREKGYANLEGF